jgi:hypothetical protein
MPKENTKSSAKPRNVKNKKLTSTLGSKLREIVIKNKDFTTDGLNLYCNICDKTLSNDIRHLQNTIDNHNKTSLHQKNKEIKANNSKKQSLLLNSFKSVEEKNNKQNTFNSKLTKAFIEAGIPLSKLSHPSLKSFFEDVMNRVIPDESTLRKSYVTPLYDETIAKIKNKIDKNLVYFIIDETTDKCQRNVLNILVGPLNGDPVKPMLLDTQFLDRTDHDSVQRGFLDACVKLWGDVRYDCVKLVVTDQAPYMVLAMKNLKIFFKQMSHVSCVAHALNRVCVSIQENNNELNSFISNMKKVILKSPYRQNLYKLKTGLNKLPPKTVQTQWSSWLNTVLYYREHFTKVKEFVKQLNPDSKSKATKKIKDLIEKKNISGSAVGN